MAWRARRLEIATHDLQQGQQTVFSGLPADTRAMQLAVIRSGTTFETTPQFGSVTFDLKASRNGVPYFRRFQLASGQDVVWQAEDYDQAELYVRSSTLDQVHQIYAAQVLMPMYPVAKSLPVYVSDERNFLGQIRPVPAGAVTATPSNNFVNLTFYNYLEDGTLAVWNDTAVALLNASPIRGTHYAMTTNNPGVPSFVIWRIRL